MKRSKETNKKAMIQPKNNTKDVSVIDKLEGYLRGKYQFKYNTVTGRVSWSGHGQNKFRELNEYEINSLYRQLLKDSVTCSKDLLGSVLHSDFSIKYDPIKEYFDQLPAWDQKNDHINELAETVRVEDNELWQTSLKKWIVAYVASLLEDAVVNQTALILVGSQGIGKSKWIDRLVPDQLSAYKYSGMICSGQKDTECKLSECILIIADELEGLTRGSIGSVKEMITKPYVNIRRPYNRYAELMVRRASFAGSVNRTDFLRDETGNRRFLCFHVEDVDYQHNVSMDHVLSQAVHLFRNKFQYWFDQSEITTVNSYNEQFRRRSFEEELFTKRYKPAMDKDNAVFYGSAADILTELEKEGGITNCERSRIALGRVLGALKVPCIKQNGRKVYALDLVKEESGENLSNAQAA